MNETINTIKRRRSVRAYKTDQVKDEDLKQIIEAGTYAPSAGNQQPWHFTVLQNKAMMGRMNQAVKEFFADSPVEHFKRIAAAEKFDVFHHAPCAVIISGDTKAMLPHIDCAAATENMLIAAESLGVGSCWTQAAAHLFESEQGESWRQELGIPAGYKPFYAIVLGYSARDGQQAPPRKGNNINIIK